MLAMYLAMLETEEDQRRFTRLFMAYEKTAYAAALRVLGNRTQAEDAAQQTWLQLLRRWDRVSALPWKETAGYVATTARNCALDMRKREQRTVPFPEDWDPPVRQEDETEAHYLLSLIRALPEGYRRVLELKLVLELTNREIAQRLGLKESTVATRVLRGRTMLKERLEEEYRHAVV